MNTTMMHYRPWMHHQQMMVDHQPYYQYAINDLQSYYSTSEHQEEDNDHTGDEMPSETSGDQSPNPDMFRLAFAASQWSKLVLNAEGLFNKLMSTNVLPLNEQNLLKNQIEQWLCMKQEYEECIAGDDSASLQGYNENTRRSLERIEEVTETDEKTDESNNWIKLQYRTKSCSGSESEVFDDEDNSDSESENPNFLEKLDEYMKKFKTDTDEILDSKKNDYYKLKDCSSISKAIINSSFVPIVKPIPIRNPSSRRMSILPYSDMSNEIVEFQKQNINSINLFQQNHFNKNSVASFDSIERNENQEKFDESIEDESTKTIIKAQHLTVDSEYINILKKLMNNNEEKQSQVKRIQIDLDLAYKQVEELQNTIKIKQQFIEDMLQNCDARNSAKQKFQKKKSKFEEKYRNIEKLLNFKRMHRNIEDEVAHKEEIEKYENLLMYYEKKLKDTKIIKQVAGNSAKTIVYLSNSLSASQKQMEMLKQRLKDEEEHKKLVEEELISNHQRIKELEEKYNITSSKLKDVISENEDEKSHYRVKMKCDDKDKNLVEENERISRLDHLLKEKLDIERIDNTDEKETLRQEIRNLRHIRDRLIDMKCKYINGRTSTTVGKERQLLLISEYVETIDAMIEQKNVMICGKVDLNQNKFNKIDEQMPIMNRLEKLSHDELVTLFYKYFYKVIDLKDSSRNLEIQNAILEESIKKQAIENDTKMIMLRKMYEQRISVFYKFYAEESSSSGYDNRNKDFERLIKENQALRNRLAHFDSLIKASGTTQAVRSNSVKNTKQVLKPELMQIALPPLTTTVTRQGNKLIIQTSEKKK
ncbi:PREDICTED: kinesin-like protein costa [Ceratosolen solmsi marchali]|uniref:Kinesin-like protein costa n=1 Tax=Ceratosolen solmsi marchali TaxID=326594 RepID=A0AAJ6YD75_9HYME|nr:PREDICTED: kinesin-like protein costa [Ceratosolen solmsi marchali]